MTEPTPLPGLEPPAQPASALEAAVRRTISALDAAGYLQESSAARTALAIELAQIISDKRQRGRTSTVANDAKVLVELLDDLLPEDAGVDAGLQKAMADWSAAIAGHPGATS